MDREVDDQLKSTKGSKRQRGRTARKPVRPLRAQAGPSVATAQGPAAAHRAGGVGHASIEIKVRPELKRALKRRAEDEGWTTLQGYLLSILMEAGLPVLPEDLVDRRQGPKSASGAQLATHATSGYRSSSRRQQRTAGLGHPWPATPALARLPDISALGLGPNCIVIVNTGETPRRRSARPAKRPKRQSQSIKTRKPRNKRS